MENQLTDNKPDIVENTIKPETPKNERREYRKRTVSGEKQIQETAKTLSRYFKMIAEKLDNSDIELTELESLGLADSWLTVSEKFEFDSESKIIAVLGFAINLINISVSRYSVIKKWKTKTKQNNQ